MTINKVNEGFICQGDWQLKNYFSLKGLKLILILLIKKKKVTFLSNKVQNLSSIQNTKLE